MMMIALRRLAILVVMACVFSVPLMAGGKLFGEYISYPAWGVCAGLFLFLLSQCANTERLDLKPVVHWPWFLVFAVVTGWILVQLFILPATVGNVFGHEPLQSPFNDSIYIDVGPVSWYLSIHFWGLFTTYWAIAYLAFCLNRKEGRWVFYFLAFSGVFHLFYALLFSKEAGDVLGIWSKERFAGVITGTYVHPNHFTGFLVMIMPMVVAAILYFVSTTKKWVFKISGYLLAALLFFVSASIVLGSSVRLSMAAFVICWLVFFWSLLKHKYKTGFLVRFLLVFGVGGLGLIVYVAENFTYIYNQLYQIQRVEGRFGVWNNILSLPSYIWIWGGGAGVFGDVYVLNSNIVLHPTRPYEEAHNDYLQFLVEFGVIGAALVAVSVLIWLYKLWPKEMPFVKIAAIAGIAGILVRLAADFDLQMPGTAVFFFLLCGLLLNPNLLDRQRKRKKKRHNDDDSLMHQAMSDVYQDS